ncbi:MAG TPA: GNAT family N-acetyltransferase [Solirubrobacteraceae bacterium]|nr:GNAT family N-acetyltransferase [Solirubrobacteraceae bacterium]
MDSVRLHSGTEVIIRPIRPGDEPALQAAHGALSERTKYLRYHGAKPHLNASETRYLVQVDGHDHVALVATPVQEPDRIVAVARFVRLPEDPQTAELAIVVGDSMQDEGLGTRLLSALADAAREHGITRFRASILAENTAMHRLVRVLPGRVVREEHEGSVDEIDVELAA